MRRPREVDHRADLFSLGCVLFHALTGAPPFEGADTLATMMATASEDAPPVGSLVEGVPAALEDAVARLLARDPDKRLGARDEREVVAALRAVEDDIKARRLGWSVPERRAAPATRETLAVPREERRAFRPGEVVDARASTVTPDPPPIVAAVATLHAAEPARAVSDPGAAPKVESGTPSPSGAARAGMHPATAALLTLLVVMVVLGGSCSACVYCTCLAPSSGGRAAPPPKTAGAKDAGASSSPKPAAKPAGR